MFVQFVFIVNCCLLWSQRMFSLRTETERQVKLYMNLCIMNLIGHVVNSDVCFQRVTRAVSQVIYSEIARTLMDELATYVAKLAT